MKKLLVLTSVVASLYAVSASAKTEGSYAGVDLLVGNASYQERNSTNAAPIGADGARINGNSDIGVGVSLKHALNFNDAFVAGGVFAEQNGVKTDTSGERLQVNNRYGVKAELGYDVTDTFAPYLTAGYALVNYRTQNNSGNNVTKIRNGMSGSWFYGAGLKFDVNKDWVVNTEYQTQNFNAKTHTDAAAGYTGTFRSNLNQFKIGAAYRF